MIRVGLISDTHGLLRPEALAYLRGSDHILHAGDIGDAAILEVLAGIAPLTAVRGNNDTEAWARKVREAEMVEIGGVSIYLLHDLAELDPSAVDHRVVVTGHSHKPLIDERNGVLYVNPGSAGPRRFTLPISVGELLISGKSVSARLKTLDILSASSSVMKSTK
jgi:putative phosphoesterase